MEQTARRVSGTEKRQRTNSVAVRFTAAETADLTAAATRAGLSTGAYLRTVAIGAPGPRAARRPPVERAELARLLGELGKVGSNLNQLARTANSGGDVAASELLAALQDVSSWGAALMKALGRGD